MASRASLIQSRSIYVGTSNAVAPSAGDLVVSGGGMIGVSSQFTFGGTAKLSVYADAPITFALSNTDAIYFRRYGVGQYQFQTTNSGGNTGDLSLQSYGGNVGIGTTAPGAKLQVGGASKITGGDWPTADAGLELNYGSNTSYVGSYDRTNSVYKKLFLFSEDLTLETGGAIRMFITNGGNVGIGTTSPSTRLEVLGDTGVITIRTSYPSDLSQRGALLWKDGANITGAIDTRYDGTTVDMYFGSLYSSGYNSTTRMVIKGNGNVGIGTTSPGQKLEVNGTIVAGTYNNTRAEITSNGRVQEFYSTEANPRWVISRDLVGGGQSGIGFNDTVGTIDVTGSAIGGSLLRALGFYTSNGTALVERMRIADGGNVGIGTTSPAYKLSVNESTTNPIAYFGLGPSNASSRNSLIILQSGTIPQNGSDTTGEVGFLFKHSYGTGGVNGTANGGYIESIRESVFGITSQVNTALVFGTSAANTDAERLRITSAGNVGIGTTAPDAKLVIVTGSTDDSGNSFSFTGYGSKEYVSISKLGFIRSRASDLNGANMHFLDNGGTTRMEMAVNASSMTWYSHALASTFMVFQHTTGNVGIGTTAPSAKLDVNGDINLTNYGSLTGGNSSNRMAIIKGTGASGNIEIGGLNNSDVIILTHVNERMRITGAGNVGIGTTAPKTILDIRPAGITGLTMPTFGTAAYGGIHIVPSGAATTEAWYGITFGNVASTSSERERSTAGIYTSASGTYGNKLYFATSNDWGIGAISRMMIDEAGNVGIGTTSPVTQLQVASATNAVDVLRIGNTAGDSGSVQGVTHLAINHFNAGTNPSTRITAYQDGVSGWPGGMYFSTRSLNTDSAPVERVRITSGGNVGIGTTSPSNILHITNVMRMDNATGNAPAVTSYTPRNGYGDVETERCLADPAVWLKINIGGTEYVIPAYTQA